MKTILIKQWVNIIESIVKNKPIKIQSIYRGVDYCKKKHIRKWRASINVKNKSKHIGYYRTELGAARAYDKAAKKHFDLIAILNFPENK